MAGGSLVSDAVAQDLLRTQSDAMLGRAAFLDRTLARDLRRADLLPLPPGRRLVKTLKRWL
jgi:hypothetical protein